MPLFQKACRARAFLWEYENLVSPLSCTLRDLNSAPWAHNLLDPKGQLGDEVTEGEIKLSDQGELELYSIELEDDFKSRLIRDSATSPLSSLPEDGIIYHKDRIVLPTRELQLETLKRRHDSCHALNIMDRGSTASDCEKGT